MGSCGFSVRPVKFAGIPFVVSGAVLHDFIFESANIEPPSRIMMPQSSVECLMKRNTYWKLFPSVF